MPSYGGAHGPDGSRKSGDQGQGTRDRDGGNTGGGRSVGGNGGFGGGGGRTASVIGNRFGAPSASAQAAAMARNRPMNGPLGGMNPNHYGGRRTTNPTSSYEMSMHNMMALGNKLAPGGMIRSGLGIGPEFRGYTGQVNGPGDYDGPNRFAVNGSSMFPNQQGLGMMPPRPTLPAEPQQQGLGMGMANAGAMNFGYQPFNGMQGQQWTRPGYSFVGSPSSFPGKPFGPILPRTPRSTGFR